MLVIPWRNDTRLVLVHKFFCSLVASPEKAAHTDAAASMDGGYIRNFSSAEKQEKKKWIKIVTITYENHEAGGVNASK